MPGPRIPAPTAGTISRQVGHDYVVVHPVSEEAHALSGPVALVWRAAQGDGKALDGLTLRDIDSAITELQTIGLLRDSAGLNRRTLMRRAGVVGGVAVGANVASIALPLAQAAASGPPQSVTFPQTTSGSYTYGAIPANTRRIDFSIRGAGGAGRARASGGSGANVTGYIRLSGGGVMSGTLASFIGAGGAVNGTGGTGGTGTLSSILSGGAGGGNGTVPGGGGGGATSLTIDNVVLVVAGGGGGAAINSAVATLTAGDGGDAGNASANGESGGEGSNGPATNQITRYRAGGGGGGTASGPGAGGAAAGPGGVNSGTVGAAGNGNSATSNAPNRGNGGAGASFLTSSGGAGGGGGGGYYGGGGGGAAAGGTGTTPGTSGNTASGGGGGGGSSYASITAPYQVVATFSTSTNGGAISSPGGDGQVINIFFRDSATP